jgi:GNAT superfamily N-acetyltransferase
VTTLDTSERALAVRAAYDAQIRSRAGSANGGTIDRAGPLIRKIGFEGSGFLLYPDLGGLDGLELDALIAAQVEHFAALGREVEWKYYTHDLPADLPDRLLAAGFRPEPDEMVLIGDVTDLATEPTLPAGVRLREVTSRADLERIQAIQETVWGESHAWLPDALSRDLEGAGDPVRVVVAEAGDQVVCACWVRFHPGTEFASLWGGSTLPEWRGRGIYRALVAYRARLAAELGYRYLQVDASPDSRGILARLGFLPVATTIPYIWRPSETVGEMEQVPLVLDGPGVKVSDSRELLLGYLDWYREAVRRKLDGLSDAQLRTPLEPFGWAPLGVVQHLGWVERRWLRWGFAAEKMDAYPPDEWVVTAPTDETWSTYRHEVEQGKTLIADAALDDVSRVGGRFRTEADAPSLSRILFHLLQEYARHVGQLDLVRELLDGSTGE